MSIYINGNPRSLSLSLSLYIYIYILLLAFMNHLKNGCIIFLFITVIGLGQRDARFFTS